MKAYIGVKGCPPDKATIEHLNRNGPFYWRESLQEKHLVIACGRCNSSRGRKRLGDWFASAYCREERINSRTVAARVKQYFRTASAEL
jgi:coenzyme F420-reducing hydrogenase gamma subunit